MDCRDGLKLIDDGMIDIVMTDIPYNISQKKSIDRSAIDSKALKSSGKKKELNFNYGKWDFLRIIRRISALFRASLPKCIEL